MTFPATYIDRLFTLPGEHAAGAQAEHTYECSFCAALGYHYPVSGDVFAYQTCTRRSGHVWVLEGTKQSEGTGTPALGTIAAGSGDRPGITAGTVVRLVDPPGTAVPYGALGTAEGPPSISGLFWVQFPERRMHTRTSEVEIVRAPQEVAGGQRRWKLSREPASGRQQLRTVLEFAPGESTGTPYLQIPDAYAVDVADALNVAYMRDRDNPETT